MSQIVSQRYPDGLLFPVDIRSMYPWTLSQQILPTTTCVREEEFNVSDVSSLFKCKNLNVKH